MPQNRTYDMEYKVQAVKLVALEIGTTKAARELGILANTLHMSRHYKPRTLGQWRCGTIYGAHF